MSKRGRRSLKATQRRDRKHQEYTLIQYVKHSSKRDRIWAETICMTPRSELRDYGYTVFGEHFSIYYIPDVDMGTITYDERGRGAFQ